MTLKQTKRTNQKNRILQCVEKPMFNLYQQEIENIIILFINIKNSKNSRCYA